MLKRPIVAPRDDGVLVTDLNFHFRYVGGVRLVRVAMQLAGVEMPPQDRRFHATARRPLTHRQMVLVMRACYQLLGRKLERFPQEHLYYLGQMEVGIAGEKPKRFRQPRLPKATTQVLETSIDDSGEDETP